MLKKIIFIAVILLSLTKLGAQWQESSNGLRPAIMSAFEYIGNKVFTGGSEGGLFVSTDNGDKWVRMNNDLKNRGINDIKFFGRNFFAGTDSGLYISKDSGSVWNRVAFVDSIVRFIESKYNTIFVCLSQAGGLYSSEDQGLSWKYLGFKKVSVTSITFKDSNIFVGTAGSKSEGIFLSKDWGNSWNKVNNGLNNSSVMAMATCGENILAGTSSSIYISSNLGSSWNPTGNRDVESFYVKDSSVYTCSYWSISKSSDYGQTWSILNSFGVGQDFRKIFLKDTIIFVSQNGLVRSTDEGKEWYRINNGIAYLDVRAIISHNNSLIVGSQKYLGYKSENNGDNWQKMGSMPYDEYYHTTWYDIYSLAAINNYLFATTEKTIFMSSDMGNSWKSVNEISNRFISLVAADNNYVFACYQGYSIMDNRYICGVVKSSDYGMSWSFVNNGLDSNVINKILIYNKKVFLGTQTGLFQSLDYGENWIKTDIGQPSVNILSVVCQGSNIVTGSDSSEIFFTTNEGKNWTKVKSDKINKPISSISIYGNNIFAGTLGQGIFLSPNLGETWFEINDGLTSSKVYDLLIKNDYIFAATNNGGVYKALIGAFPVSVEDNKINNKNEITLSPNPTTEYIEISGFNPPAMSWAEEQIRIYNALGEIVLTAGAIHELPLRIDVSSLPPGLYFVRVGDKANKFVKI